MYKILWSKISFVIALVGLVLGFFGSVLIDGSVGLIKEEAECIVLRVGEERGLLTTAQRAALTKRPNDSQPFRSREQYLRSNCAPQ